MSARIPDTLLVSEVLKPTGFDCPEDLEGVPFNEAVSGGSATTALEDNKEVTITSNGTIEIIPTAGHDYKGMKKVTATVNVAGGSDIESNKAVTIDVSTYTEPVEITPTAGKDGMAKATVTLSNIPSGGSATGYHWTDNVQNRNWWFSFGTSPTDETAFNNSKYMSFTVNNSLVRAIFTPFCNGFFGEGASYTLTKVSDTQFILTYEGQDITFTRDSSKDFTLW